MFRGRIPILQPYRPSRPDDITATIPTIKTPPPPPPKPDYKLPIVTLIKDLKI